jgi:hypothetical protein
VKVGTTKGSTTLSFVEQFRSFEFDLYRVSQLRLSNLIYRLFANGFFMKFKMQIFQTVKVQLVIIKLPQVKKCNFNTCFLYQKLWAIITRLLNIKK